MALLDKRFGVRFALGMILDIMQLNSLHMRCFHNFVWQITH